METAAVDADELLDRFLAQFGDHLSSDAASAYCGPGPARPPQGGQSGLTEHLMLAAHQWRVDLDELTKRLATVEADLPDFERRASSPAATDDDKRALRIAKGSRKLLGAQINSLTRDYWISVLERYGVLPNYTLLDDSVTLDVGVTWIDPDSNAYMGEELSYRRGSRVALTELAPGATFYAQGLAVTIDAVDLGTGESNIHSWQVCPQCGWAGISPVADGHNPSPTCPRCHNGGIADVSQHLQVVEMTRVSAEVRRDEATINDIRDERKREQFTVGVAADIDPAHAGRTWFRADSDFGAEYLRRVDIRWLNLGRRSFARQEAHDRRVRDRPTDFSASARRADNSTAPPARNNSYEHRTWCRLRDAPRPKMCARSPWRGPCAPRACCCTCRQDGVRQLRPSQPRRRDHAGAAAGDRRLARTSRRHHHQRRAARTGPARPAHPRHRSRRHRVPGRVRRPHQGLGGARRGPAGRAGMPMPGRRPARVPPLPAAVRVATGNGQGVPRHRTETPRRHPRRRHPTPPPTSTTGRSGSPRRRPRRPRSSDESFLERDFYFPFLERLKLMGATVVEKPGTYGPSATITLQGKKPRKWSLRPQVSLGFVKPDFMLQTADPAIPQIAIFGDGRAFHATPDNNRIADDADKRAALRSAGYLVWSFGHDDLQRFKSGEPAEPAWFDQKAASIVTGQFHVQPGLVRLLAKDPVSQLLEFMVDPEVDAWAKFGTYLPFLFVRSDNRARSDVESIAAAATATLDGATPFPQAGPDVCWAFTEGGVTVTAGVHTMADPPRAVLAVDDRDEQIGNLDGKAWKEWLRLSNWLGLSDRHRVTTYSLLSAAPVPAAAPSEEGTLPAEWQTVFAEAVSDARTGSHPSPG